MAADLGNGLGVLLAGGGVLVALWALASEQGGCACVAVVLIVVGVVLMLAL